MNLEAELHRYCADALSIAVIRDYQIAELMVCGTGITVHTRFQAASISKMVFSFAVLRLIADGKLSLDDDIGMYIDPLYLQRSDGSLARATVRQILSHTAGFQVHGFDGYDYRAKLPTLDQIITGTVPSNSTKVVQENAPGEKWSYSGGGFIILQKCIENISGESFPQLMDSLVLEPLEMSDSTFRQDITENLATGYTARGISLPGGHMIMPELAAAGLWTTAADLAKFGIHLQTILAGNQGLLPQELVKEMVSPHCVAVTDSPCHAGLGCFLTTIGNMNFFGHSGDNIGFESQVNYSLRGGNGYCILVNSDEAYPLIKRLAADLCGSFH